jgi:enediyne biosynthesis protein E4
VATEAGLNVKTIYGGEFTNKYLLETTGCGLAFYDYDGDGYGSILFLVNGWRLEGFPAGQEPRCHLFKNNRDGTFTDVTAGSGLEHKTGWGQACCVGDYNNDGHDDLFVTYYGQNVLYRNNGDGTFGCHSAGGTHTAGTEDSLEYRLHISRLRQGWESRSVCGQLCGLSI